MTDQPTVTIGLPVFNGQNYLSVALDSLLAQSFGDFEIVISDNASTDRTPQICQDYAASDVRIRYFRQPENIGAIGNFNATFGYAQSRYFKWASHDDVCEETFLEKCVSILDERSDVMWCYSDSDMIDAFGQSWLDRLPENDEEIELEANGKRRWKGLPRVDFDHDSPHRRFRGVLLGTRWSVDSYGLIRTDALRRTRLLLDLYGSEKVLIGELSLLGKTFQIPELLFKQRVHAEASSYVERDELQHQFVTARNKKPFFPTRFAILQAHYGAVRHVRLSKPEKYRCYLALARYVLQVNKWWHVSQTVLHGQGVGGGGKRIIDASRRAATASQRT